VDKLKGKSAIVTGATSGMGRAAAVLFAEEGTRVVASGRDEERGAGSEIRSAGGRAVFVAGDVSLLETNERLVATSIREHGGVDVVMANAGMLGLGQVTDLVRRDLAADDGRQPGGVERLGLDHGNGPDDRRRDHDGSLIPGP
jgi:NAD(P)-dependent dehydrogenase (short-subunit alcohol dehydrogenase family)